MPSNNLRVCTLSTNAGDRTYAYGLLRKGTVGGETLVFEGKHAVTEAGLAASRAECEAELLRRQPRRLGSDLMRYEA